MGPNWMSANHGGRVFWRYMYGLQVLPGLYWSSYCPKLVEFMWGGIFIFYFYRYAFKVQCVPPLGESSCDPVIFFNCPVQWRWLRRCFSQFASTCLGHLSSNSCLCKMSPTCTDLSKLTIGSGQVMFKYIIFPLIQTLAAVGIFYFF